MTSKTTNKFSPEGLIARLTKSALDDQIDATVANESKLLDEFGRFCREADRGHTW